MLPVLLAAAAVVDYLDKQKENEANRRSAGASILQQNAAKLGAPTYNVSAAKADTAGPDSGQFLASTVQGFMENQQLEDKKDADEADRVAREAKQDSRQALSDSRETERFNAWKAGQSNSAPTAAADAGGPFHQPVEGLGSPYLRADQRQTGYAAGPALAPGMQGRVTPYGALESTPRGFVGQGQKLEYEEQKPGYGGQWAGY